MLKHLLTTPTPREFFYILIAYSVISVILGYFLADGVFTFTMAILLIIAIVQIKPYLKPPVSNNIKPMFLSIVFVFGYLLLINNDLVFRKDLANNINELQTITATIPKEHYYKSSSGKGSRSRAYLPLNDQYFHCGENDMNDCDKIYQYADKQATVWYQADNFYGNLIYQINVDGQNVYNFDNQLAEFKANRKQKDRKLLWGFLLFVLPSFWFWWQNKRIFAELPKLDEQQEQELAQKQKERQQVLSKGSGKRVFVIVLAIALVFLGLAMYWGNQTMIILMIIFILLIFMAAIMTVVLQAIVRFFKEWINRH